MSERSRTAAAAARFEVVDPRSPEAIESMSAYFDELDQVFPTGFDPGDTLTADASEFDPPVGAFVVIHIGDAGEDEVAGCGGVHTFEHGVSEIKRMWVDPAWRGVGLAPRLLADLESRAVAMGHRIVRLDTNATLTTAIAMYERAGYQPIEPYNDNPFAQCWFEKHIT